MSRQQKGKNVQKEQSSQHYQVYLTKKSILSSFNTWGRLSHCCNPYQKLSCPSEYGNRTDEKPPSETEGRKDQHLAFETSHLSQVTHPKMIQQCAD